MIVLTSVIRFSFRSSAALLVFALGVAVATAKADTVSFTYSGVGDSNFDPDGIASGTGSFTTADSNNPAGIGDLSAFSFNLSVTIGGLADNYSYGLGDLTDFEATFTNGTLTDLSLTTDTQPATYNYFTFLDVSGLGSDQAFTSDGDGDTTSYGAISLTQSQPTAPEPGPFTLTASGLTALFVIFRRRLGIRSRGESSR
jgi:hypothetical protein